MYEQLPRTTIVRIFHGYDYATIFHVRIHRTNVSIACFPKNRLALPKHVLTESLWYRNLGIFVLAGRYVADPIP